MLIATVPALFLKLDADWKQMLRNSKICFEYGLGIWVANMRCAKCCSKHHISINFASRERRLLRLSHQPQREHESCIPSNVEGPVCQHFKSNAKPTTLVDSNKTSALVNCKCYGPYITESICEVCVQENNVDHDIWFTRTKETKKWARCPDKGRGTLEHDKVPCISDSWDAVPLKSVTNRYREKIWLTHSWLMRW